MFQAFQRRRPWAVALITLLFGAFVGMLYLNRGRLALVYLAAEFASFAVAAYLFPSALVHFSTSGFDFLVRIPATLVGIIQGISIARHRNEGEALKWFSHWYAIVGIVLALPAAALLTRTFLYQPFNLPATSMSPSLNQGDYFVVSKFAYRNAPPQRGDIVVFHPAAIASSFVKRIVGLPGERIQVVAGVLHINGVAVAQKRVEDFVEPCDGQSCRVPQYRESFPGGRTDLILDRIGNGPGDNTEVFVVPKDSYFVLGDNRDNSMDSRMQEVGFVARNSIVGKVEYRFVKDGHLTWDRIP